MKQMLKNRFHFGRYTAGQQFFPCPLPQRLSTCLVLTLIWLCGFTVTIWPIESWASPHLQGGEETIPPSQTPVPPRLTLQQWGTEPPQPVIGHEFVLNIQLGNDTAIDLKEIFISVRDLHANWALMSLDAFRAAYIPILPAARSTTISRRLEYQSGIDSGRQLEIVIDYEYELNGETKSEAQIERINFSVVEPTVTPTPAPTATATHTPIPAATSTHTPLPTHTPVPTETPNIAATVQSQLEATQTADAMLATRIAEVAAQAASEAAAEQLENVQLVAPPAESPSPEPTFDASASDSNPGADPEADADEAAENDGGTEQEEPMPRLPTDPDVVVQFIHVPAVVAPEQFFTMTLQVRNLHPQKPLQNVVVEWGGFVQPNDDTIYIVDTGSGRRWFVGDVAPGAVGQSRPRRFYVQKGIQPGIHTGTMTIHYHKAGKNWQVGERLNIFINLDPTDAGPTDAGSIPEAAAESTVEAADVPEAQVDSIMPLWLRLLCTVFCAPNPNDEEN